MLDKQMQTNQDESDIVGEFIFLQYLIIEMKLREAEKTVQFRRPAEQFNAIETIEKRIESYQLEMNAKFELSFQQKLDQYKAIELNKVQFDFDKKYQFVIDKMNSEHDMETDLLRKQYEHDLESQLYVLKQKVVIVEKENSQIRKHSIQTSTEKLNQESNERLDQEDALNKLILEKQLLIESNKANEEKIYAMKMDAERTGIKMLEELSTSKIQLQKDFVSHYTALEIDKGKLEAESKRIDEYKREIFDQKFIIDAQVKDIDGLRKQNMELDFKNDTLIRENKNVINENRDLHLKRETQTTTSSVEFEIMSLKKFDYES